MMKLKQCVGGGSAPRSCLSWLESHLEVVDFLRSGRPVALLQRGSADQWGELRIGKQFKWLPESGWWFLWSHPHPQSCRQNVLLIGLSLGLLHQGLFFLVYFVGLSRWHPGATVSQTRGKNQPRGRKSLKMKEKLFDAQSKCISNDITCIVIVKLRHHRKWIAALSDKKGVWKSLKQVQKGGKKTVVLIKSSHSNDSRSSRLSVIGVPGFIQKRCSPHVVLWERVCRWAEW